MAAVAAVLACVLLGGVAGAVAAWQATAADRRLAAEHRATLTIADGRYLKALPINAASGARSGTAFLYQGTPSWLLITLSGLELDGAYEMVIVDRDGAAHPSGVCQVQRGRGTYGYPLYRPVADVAAIELRGPGGVTLTAVS
ncbi:MAG: hypothetical protein HOV79_19985 [Hamadaea sp.]|nr:hypothetical protein [Hamadaea sp.]